MHGHSLYRQRTPRLVLRIGGLRVIAPERTYWEKLLILHGAHCGYRDAGRLPADKDRISRHYYDVAVITATEVGQSALVDMDLLGRGSEPQPHRLPADLEAVRGSCPRIGEAGPASWTAQGDRARLPSDAGHDPRRWPGRSMGHGSAPICRSCDKRNLGLNLQEASYVFHLDRWWNPGHREPSRGLESPLRPDGQSQRHQIFLFRNHRGTHRRDPGTQTGTIRRTHRRRIAGSADANEPRRTTRAVRPGEVGAYDRRWTTYSSQVQLD